MTHAIAAETLDDHPIDEKPSRNLPSTSEHAAREAREQADAYESIFASTPLELDNDEGTLMVPLHPDYSMLDDDRMEAWDELMFRVDTEYDREDDVFVPEQHLQGEDGKENGIVLPSTTVQGQLKRPFRINGELVKPPHSIMVVQTVLGDEEYARLRRGGKSAADVWKVWGEQSLRIRERQQRDPKSAGSTLAVAPVSKTNS